MDINKKLDFLKSKTVIVMIVVLLGCALLLGVFSVGIAVGYRKAKFSYAWGDNYHRNFGGPRGGFMKDLNKDFIGNDFIGAHGTFGQIISIDGSELVVKGKDNVERIIVVKENTDIRIFRDSIQLKDVLVNEFIVVIGEPNDIGKIEAKFIRIMPPPPKYNLINNK